MIKNTFSVLLFSMSVTLMEVHTFLPHTHDEELNTEYNDWLAFLSEIIGNDLGSGHLEEIILNDNSNPDIKPLLFLACQFHVLITPLEKEKTHFLESTYKNPSYNEYLRKATPHRGPPKLSLSLL